MFGIRFMKAAPTVFVIHFKQGKVRREGAGLSFFYYAPTSTITKIPMASADLPFVFNLVTRDFQALTVQGQLTYRVREPKRVAGLLDFSVRADGKYQSEDPEAMRQRLVHAAQILTQTAVEKMTLGQALMSAAALAVEVLAGLRSGELASQMGLEIMDLAVLSVRPTPEMARALEAEAREALQRRADEAIYSRRNAAVEQERVIKENELNTEIAVETKKRQIRETQMSADIAVEQQRASLIERRVENDRKEAEGRAYALEATLKPVRDMDWRTLTALAPNGGDPKLAVALAFRELAQNAQRIGQLSVTPDLLQSLLGKED
jgi:hypothetical protein